MKLSTDNFPGNVQMNRSLNVIFLCLAVATSSVHAQTQFKNEDPFKPVIGRWKTGEAKFSSITSEPEFESRNTNWTGKMFGVIKPSGQILFKAANGCILSGFASPFASNGLWAINGQLEGCTVDHFNQKIFGNLRREGPEIVVEVSDLPFAVGRPAVGYYVKTRMIQY